MIEPAGRGDVGAFTSRLLRLDPAALVRLRPVPGAVGVTELWGMLPFGVLACRPIVDGPAADRTVAAAELLAWLEEPTGRFPAARDAAWKWPLPPRRGTVVERIPTAEVLRLARAASATLRVAVEQGVGGRQVGERVVRDALLDHVAIAVTGPGGERVNVSQRLVQGLVRMNFPAPDGEGFVTVRVVGVWIGLLTTYGSVWHRPVSPLRLN